MRTFEFSPNGRYLLSASFEVADISTATELQPVLSLTGFVGSASFTPDNRLAIVIDEQYKLIDFETNEETILDAGEQTGFPFAIAVSPMAP